MTESIRPDDDVPQTRPGGEIEADFDWSNVSPSTAVIETLAIALGRDPKTIDPLFDSVNPDALDALVSSDGNGPPEGGLSVSFTHVSHELTVDAAGTVITRPVEPHRE